MTPDLLDLGRRAVACHRWRFLGGERWRFDVSSHASLWSRSEGAEAGDDDGNQATEADPRRRGPVVIDLSDPATLGCLLALVREAWGDPPLVVVCFRQEGRWCVASRDGRAMFAAGRYFWGDTEAAALVAALEAAP